MKNYWSIFTFTALQLFTISFAFSQNEKLYTPGKLSLTHGQSVKSGALNFVMQKDGNLVLYNNGKAVWASNTVGKCSPCRAAYQNDGNLVIYNTPNNKAIFAVGHGSGALSLKNTAPYVELANVTVLPGSLELKNNQSFSRSNLKLVMQSDGNLVLYAGSKALWASNTSGKCKNCRAVYQGDGNLVIYNQDTKAAIFASGHGSKKMTLRMGWPHLEFSKASATVAEASTSPVPPPAPITSVSILPEKLRLLKNQSVTYKAPQLRFVMQGDGNLVLYTETKALWASHTAGKCTNCKAVYQIDGNLVISNLDTKQVIYAKGLGSKKLILKTTAPFVEFDGEKVVIAAASAGATRAPASAESTFKALDSNVALGFHSVARNAAGAAQDFLFQKVCQDASGRALAQDPATCSNKRNLRVGEPIPYVLQDRAWGTSYIQLKNIPHLKGNSLRSVSERDFTASSAAPGFPRSVNDYDPLSDGYDIVEADGNFVSAIATTDPVTLNDRFSWFGGDCRRDDAWIHFPTHLASGQSGNKVSKITGGVTCNPNNMSQSLTTYHRYSAPMTYTSGKKLETIQTFHFAGHDTSKDLHHAEVFYHTNPYGLTRWERWETAKGCAETAAMSGQTMDQRCGAAAMSGQQKSGMCNGAVETYLHGQRFLRVDCRDWSFVQIPQVAHHPYSTPLHLDFVTSKNLLQSADFAGPSIGGWNKLGATHWNFKTDPASKNISLAMACHGPCNGNSLYQDVNPNAVINDYGTGALVIQTSAEISGPLNSTATLAIHIFDRNNRATTKRMQITLKKSGKNQVSFHVPWNFSVNHVNAIRFEVYLHSQGEYQIDETVLALLPQK